MTGSTQGTNGNYILDSHIAAGGRGRVLPHREVVFEQSWLVARGVRALALLGTVNSEPGAMRSAHIYLAQHGDNRAIPFVMKRDDTDYADVGFAAAQWVIDLLDWSYRCAPARQGHCIVGMLLGYSPPEIASHDLQQFAGLPTDVSMSK